MDAVPVVADAKRALPVLLKALGEYCAPYTTEVEAARERWFKELSRLRGIAYGEGYVPEVNDANAASADRFAVDLDAVLTQTAGGFTCVLPAAEYSEGQYTLAADVLARGTMMFFR